MEQFTIGIDVGGTSTVYGVFDANKNVIKRLKHPSNADLAPELFFDSLAGNIKALMSECKIKAENILGIGLGMPSFILYDEGYIVKTANLTKIKDFPARSYLSEKLEKIRVILDNDARAAGLAEYYYGAGRGYSKMLYCPLSTGISSALLINGEPFRGSYGWAGESGHMIATPGEGLECGCGNRGCFMSLCSGSMIVKHIRNWIKAGESTIMADLAGGVDNIDSFILEEAFDSGDEMAKKALKQMTDWLGLWFFNLYVSLNVNCFVVGGGLVNMGEKFLSPIRRRFDEFNMDGRPVYFKAAECGEDYGVLGAVQLVYSAMENVE